MKTTEEIKEQIRQEILTNGYARGCVNPVFLHDHPEWLDDPKWLPNLVDSIFNKYSSKAKGIPYPLVSSLWCNNRIAEKIWKLNHNEEDKTNESLD
jgi:hypothetical protein